MSKFENFSVNDGNNQFGNNNTQNNITNNNYHINKNNNNKNGNNKGGDEYIPISIGVLGAFAFMIWWFFGHIDLIYSCLYLLTLSSGLLSFLATFILFLNASIDKNDIFRFTASALFSLGLFGLALLARNHAPADVIQLSEQVKPTIFWKQLTGNEKDLVIANFFAAISIGIGAIFVHLGSIRQIMYSLSNKNRTGFFYALYSYTNIFRMRVVIFIVSLCSGAALAALNGMLPSFNT